MIYIVFDTNIWVYLANGYDSEKENYYQGVFSEHHFDLLEILKKKVDNGDFKILVNDLFFKEWERNKHTTEALINFLELRMREILKSRKLIKAFISQEDFISQKVLTEKAIKAVNIKIERNKKHIQEVEDFLENECIKISISDEVLKKVSLLAMEKNVAPFLNDKKNGSIVNLGIECNS
jgi:predicted nucleic acid-binding protein